MSEDSSSDSFISEEDDSTSSGDNIYVYGDGLIPDCSGAYRLNGSGGGKPMYQRLDNCFIIQWKDTFGRWELIDFATAQHWERSNEDVFGEFSPSGDSQGHPMISVTPKK